MIGHGDEHGQILGGQLPSLTPWLETGRLFGCGERPRLDLPAIPELLPCDREAARRQEFTAEGNSGWNRGQPRGFYRTSGSHFFESLGDRSGGRQQIVSPAS